MPIPKEIKIVKVPLSDTERMPDYPMNFSSMPELYLSLLENKAKIKQELVNTDYVPLKKTEIKIDQEVKENREKNSQEKEKEKKRHDSNQEKEKEKKRHDSNQEKEKEKKKHESSREKEKNETETPSVSVSSDNSSISIGQKEKVRKSGSIESVSESVSKQSISSSSQESKESRESKNSQEKSSPSLSSSHSSPVSHSSVASQESISENLRSTAHSDDDDELSARLKELLGEHTSEAKKNIDKYSQAHKSSVESKTSRFMDYNVYKQANEQTQPMQPAPSLKDLEEKGQYQRQLELADVSRVNKTENEIDDKKREILFKFTILKRSYPLAVNSIPEFTIHTDLREMEKSYEDTVKRLSLDSTVESYKQYLIGFSLLIEFVFGNYLNFDMSGYTTHTMMNISSYNTLLTELGAKSYMPEGSSKWPVEIRLLGLMMLNASIYIISKMIFRKTGANLLNMTNPPTQPSMDNRPRRKMRGPTIDVNDISGQATNPTNPTNPTEGNTILPQKVTQPILRPGHVQSQPARA